MKISKLIIAAAIAATPMYSLAGDAAAGEAKSKMCATCHGNNGKATMPTYPNLAGQNAAYLEMALKDYRAGKRNGAMSMIMTGQAAGLTDADIANLAAYYSSMK